MYYSEEIIDEVREKNDIVDVISPFVRLTKRGGNYVGLCPFHGEKTPSFSVSRNKQIFHCFGCGAGGNVITFLMKYENFTFAEAVEELADKAGVRLPVEREDEESKKRADLRSRLLDIYRETAKFYYFKLRDEQGASALSYLKDRELTDEVINSFGLGYAPKSGKALYEYLRTKGYSNELMLEAKLIGFKEGRGVFDMFRNRVIFPIMDQNNKVIAFGGRVMGEGMPKYLNSVETLIFNKRKNLYGLNTARHSKENYILLCEGYMDVIALHQAGFNSAAASLGTALTPEQARLIARYAKEAVISYDSDEAGVKAALRAIPILKDAGVRVKVLSLKPHKDPDDFIRALGREEYLNRIKNAESSFNFEISNLESGYNLSDPEEKTEFFYKVSERLTEFTEEIERENYLTAVTEKYFISKDALRQLVNKIGISKEFRKTVKETENIIKNKDRISTADEGKLKANRLLISFISERPENYGKIKHIISAEDFLLPLYRDIAERLFSQIESGKNPDVSAIISRYETGEEQSEVTAVFEERFDSDIDEGDIGKVFKEITIRVKKAALDAAMQEAVETGRKELLPELIKKQGELKKISL